MTRNPAASDTTLRTLLAASREVVSILDENYRVRFSSASLDAQFGFSPEERVGRSVLELIHPDDVAAVTAVLDTVRATAHALDSVECRILHRDGSWRDIEVTVRNLLDDRAVNGLVSYVLDVTDRRRTESELRDSRGWMQRIMNGAVDFAIYALDADGRIASWSAGAERIKGYTAAAAIGQPYAMLFTPEERIAGADDRILERARRTGRADAEGWRLRADGTRVWSSGAVDAIHDDSGAVIGFAVISRDLTEQRQREEALRQREAQIQQAQKLEALGQLAGGVAHDVNNVLTAIGGFTRLIEMDLVGEPGVLQFVREIELAKERAAALTNQLLAFSRRNPSHPQLIDLNAVVGDIHALLHRLIGEHVQLDTRLAPVLPPVMADPRQIEQTVMNLVINARDAMPEGGRIEIATGWATTPDGDVVVLTVADDGCGMDEETRAHIFDPFYTTKADGAGTGLGLATVARIVADSDGRIDVESEPGVGSRFIVTLPATTGAVAERRTNGRGALRGGSETILLVEDDTNVRRILATILRRSGYSVLEAQNSEEAERVYAASTTPVALLLTDVVMPGGRGPDLAQRLRDAAPDLPVLYISGYAQPLLGQETGGDAMLEKPCSPDELLAAVRTALHTDLPQETP